MRRNKCEYIKIPDQESGDLGCSPGSALATPCLQESLVTPTSFPLEL